MRYYESIIAISDLQCPFHHKDSLDFLYEIKRSFYISDKKTKVINQGDETDQHSLGRWVTNPDGHGGGRELELAKKALDDLWEIFPKQDICISNHTWRGFKAAKNAGLPRAFIRDIKEVLRAPDGVRWAQDWVYNNIIFEHGERVSGPNAAMNAAIQNGMSTSIGHQHSWGGVKWIEKKSGVIFGMNTGCLIDLEQYAFEYMKGSRQKPVLGIGVILDNVAYFIPMLLDKNHRWTGNLGITAA